MSYQTDKNPDVPAGYRLLQTGERIEKGDLHWMGGKWREIVESIDMDVPLPAVGFYCRKTD